jgi:site-specific DNA-methyltransferase (adenine-specific)
MSYRILEGDVIEQLKTLADASVDSIVTDPPYGLEFMGKDWDAPWKTDRRQGFNGTMQMPNSPYGRSKVRNGSGASYGADARVMQALQEWHFSWAQEALRVLKPGGYLLAFGGSRTFHRLACAIEDAGFEIRDQIQWIYSSGFPKSVNVSKAIDKAMKAERVVVAPAPYKRGTATQRYSETRNVSYDYPPLPITAPATASAKQWTGWGTALKPAHETIVVARKPLEGTVAANVLKYGTGALNIDVCRISSEGGTQRKNEASQNRRYSGSGSTSFSLKPGPRGGDPLGRWPANVIHDGSEEVVNLFPQTTSGMMKAGTVRAAQDEPGSVCFGVYGGNATSVDTYGDSGSAARFFYCAKVSREERNKGCEGLNKKPMLWSAGTQSPGTFQSKGTDRSANNAHPTVKPLALMTYLCRLVTPPKGTVLDLFMGSGSTGIAALREGFDFIGIELNPEYVKIARLRIEADAPLFNAAQEEGAHDQIN